MIEPVQAGSSFCLLIACDAAMANFSEFLTSTLIFVLARLAVHKKTKVLHLVYHLDTLFKKRWICHSCSVCSQIDEEDTIFQQFVDFLNGYQKLKLGCACLSLV